jgi:hypothetical protein
MSFVSRGFHGRRRSDADSSRIPPGQYVTPDFPVLSAGPTPHRSLELWNFSIIGEVDEPRGCAPATRSSSAVRSAATSSGSRRRAGRCSWSWRLRRRAADGDDPPPPPLPEAPRMRDYCSCRAAPNQERFGLTGG